MSLDVNDNPADLTLRAARIADTEAKVLRAAAELFVRLGYSATTLRAVAKAAAVGERTVYVRFGTKAALLKRVIDVAIVGDTEPVDVMGREWFRTSVTAPTAPERIAAAARGGREIMQRAGALIGVGVQAEAIEPLVAAAAQAGREATRDTMRLFWTRMAEDGLLPPGADVAWLGDTAALLGSAQTYLLMTQTLGWDFDTYEEWLHTTWTRLASVSATARSQRPSPLARPGPGAHPSRHESRWVRDGQSDVSAHVDTSLKAQAQGRTARQGWKR